MTEPDEIVDDPSTAVAAAFIHDGGGVTYSFFHSWDSLVSFDLVHEVRLPRGGRFSIRAGTDGLADARNTAVKSFLAESKAHWLWWVDTDMGFPPETVELLLQAADPIERPIVGALCFANRDVAEDGTGGRVTLSAPVILDWKHIDAEAGFDTRWNYPQNTVTRCDGVGSACVLIHRSVFERIAAEYGPNWYSRARNPTTNQMISEDLSFCARVMALEIPVHVHTGVKTTHQKDIWLSEDVYWAQRVLNPPATSGDGSPIPAAIPTWTVPRFAIVPTHNRPARLLALTIALGPQCDHIVVLDNASTPPVDAGKLQASVPAHCTVTVIRDEQQPPNLARFWNVMFDHCAKLRSNLPHRPDCSLNTTHHLTCSCGTYGAQYDVAVFNDDAIVPAGWYDRVAGQVRKHQEGLVEVPGPVVAHTGTAPVFSPDLVTSVDYERSRRMCPWAFVVRGEVGLRADESMWFWFFDDDFNRQAILAGGVLAVPGPIVINAHANESTFQNPVLLKQTELDRETFVAKWGGMP